MPHKIIIVKFFSFYKSVEPTPNLLISWGARENVPPSPNDHLLSGCGRSTIVAAGACFSIDHVGLDYFRGTLKNVFILIEIY